MNNYSQFWVLKHNELFLSKTISIFLIFEIFGILFDFETAGIAHFWAKKQGGLNITWHANKGNFCLEIHN